MEAKIIVGRWGGAAGGAIKRIIRNIYIVRRMTGKASNRTAVHGSKLPVNETIINREEVEEEIDKEKERKSKKREEVEKKIDSQLKDSNGRRI